MPVPVPSDFAALALAPGLLAVLGELGFTGPTPVQAASIPALLAGRDLLGQSKTGSGKTAAYLLPLLQRLQLASRALQAVVLCPTRELCSQVARETRKLGRRHTGLVVLEVAGGQPIQPQLAALRRGVHVVIATPGRMLDHLGRGSLETGAIAMVVLDEADRMLDMGFGPDVERILDAVPRARQTALFSATIPKSIETLGRTYLRNPVRAFVDEPEEAALEIRQLRLVAEPDEKFGALCWLLHRYPHESALIFCNLKATVLELTRALVGAGLSADRLDGDLEQFQRDQVLARFRNQSLRLLVATDVAGRGLDVTGLDLVINYELPQQPELYVHRIGRTGRAGQAGLAISLTTARQAGRLRVIEELTGVPLESVQRSPANDPGRERILKTITRGATMETVLISVGRKDKIRAGDILGALTGEAGGLQGADIGRIEIQDRLSYVAVSRRVARKAAACLSSGRIKGRKVRASLVGTVDPSR